uniref:PHD-type domain-containing protein n=1 Tax=Gouania willdenowi TaxID=441366 RepID=A0A8C5G714_GOUWI
MTSTGSAILSVLPDYCELFRDPVLPIRSLQSLVTGTGLNRQKYKDCTILQACSSEDRNFCLYVVNGQVHLKKNHQYYTQVQTQLFVTESSYCDFVVWTLMDTVILRIVALPELAVQYLTIPPTSQPSSGHSVLRELQQSKPQQIGGKRQRKQHAQKAKEVWCLCAGPEEGEMVACDNQNCPVQWYHFSCVGLVDKPSADTPWFCPSCKKKYRSQ